MSVLMPLTLHLSVAMGVYALAASLGLLLSPPERSAQLLDDMAQSPGLTFAFGLIALVTGSAWILAHHEWITPLGIVITLAGWWIAIEGALILAFPGPLMAFALRFKGHIRLWGLVGVILGIMFIVLGLTGRADAGVTYI